MARHSERERMHGSPTSALHLPATAQFVHVGLKRKLSSYALIFKSRGQLPKPQLRVPSQQDSVLVRGRRFIQVYPCHELLHVPPLALLLPHCSGCERKVYTAERQKLQFTRTQI